MLPRPTAKPTQLSRYCSLLSHLGLPSPLPTPSEAGPGALAMPGPTLRSPPDPLPGSKPQRSPLQLYSCYLKENHGAG